MVCDVKIVDYVVLSVDSKINSPIVTDICVPVVTAVWEVLVKGSKASDPTVTIACNHGLLSGNTVPHCFPVPTICEPLGILQDNKPIYTTCSIRTTTTQESIGKCSVAAKEPFVYHGGTLYSVMNRALQECLEGKGRILWRIWEQRTTEYPCLTVCCDCFPCFGVNVRY